jgi:hypothetical protein
MMNFISGCKGAVQIMQVKVTKVTCAMLSPLPAGKDSLRLNLRGVTWEPGISTGIETRMAKMQMGMRGKKQCKLMMDQHRMCRTEGIVDLTWEPVMMTGMSVRIAKMWMQMRRNDHRKPMMDRSRIIRTEGIVLESVKIGLYISEL